MKTSKNVCLRLLLLACLLPSNALAQQPAPGPPSQRLASLAQALRAMPPASVGEGAIALTVGAERVPLAPTPPLSDEEAAVPDAAIPTPQSLAAQYGRLGGWFGHVYALAPPAMTVLSSNPALADLPLSVLASQHPLPFFIGSLTEEQLRQMGTTGLAPSDLTPDQQALMRAILPHPFGIVPKASKEPMSTMADMQKTGPEREEIDRKLQEKSQAYAQQIKTVSDDTVFASGRLHGFLAGEFTFDSPAGSGISMNPGDGGFETTGAYKAAHGGRADYVGPDKNPVSAYLKMETPNAPKEGDFIWNGHDLERPVPLQGVKTVDDLAARLAQATKLELYADPHFGRQPVLLVGDLLKPQPAGDVMQALVLCVCGAWRQVGPAYVLTDDVQGVGARQEFLREMVQTWSGRLTTASEDVGGHLRDMNWLHTLHFADGDVGALPPDQLDAIIKEHGTNSGHLLWKDLPDALRRSLRGELEGGASEDNFAQTAKAVAGALKPETSVEVTFKFQIALSLPETGAMALDQPYRVQVPREPRPASSTSAPAGSVPMDKPLRGVLCAPKTPEEARAVVAKLPQMGLNMLFLDVFTNGRTYFPNAALPPASEKAAGVLQAALDAAKAQHIPVYAVLDTLCWRKDGASIHPLSWPAGFSEDLTVGGEAPDHAVQRELDAHSTRPDTDREFEMAQKGAEGWASPLDPKVRRLMPALVHALAGTPGLAGLAFQDTATVGYRNLDYEYDDEGISLGYTPENRLAYLRAYHTDPVDLSAGYDNLQLFLPSEGFSTSFDVSLPNFRSSDQDTKNWNKVRGEADKALLADCYTAARQAAPALPLFMRERQIGFTFDPWTDGKTPNQYLSTNTLDYPFRQINARSILSIPYGPVERAHPKWFVYGANDRGGEDAKRAGGEVFDLVTGGPPDSLADTLDHLSAFLKKPAQP